MIEKMKRRSTLAKIEEDLIVGTIKERNETISDLQKYSTSSLTNNIQSNGTNNTYQTNKSEQFGIIADEIEDNSNIQVYLDKDKSVTDDSDDSTPELSDLATLKAKTSQLNLKTRRPSYLLWKEECMSRKIDYYKTDSNDPLSDEAEARINASLKWIRNELGCMRTEDQILAKKFLKLRTDIHELKLKWSCENHEDMLECTHEALEDVHTLQMICDRPAEPLRSEPLRKFGVTKMNITSRRFSTC